VEQADVFVGTGELTRLRVGVGIPLAPLEAFTLHLLDQVLEDLDLLETDNCGPHNFRDHFEVLWLVGHISRLRVRDEGVNFFNLQ